MLNNRCVSCGEIIPEGRQVCLNCKNENLKPCPFCGGKAVLEKRRSFAGVVYSIKCSNENGCPMYYLSTKKSLNKKEVVRAWNRRANENERI